MYCIVVFTENHYYLIVNDKKMCEWCYFYEYTMFLCVHNHLLNKVVFINNVLITFGSLSKGLCTPGVHTLARYSFTSEGWFHI